MSKIRNYGNMYALIVMEKKIHKLFLKCFGSGQSIIFCSTVIAKVILQQREESFQVKWKDCFCKYEWENCQLTNPANKSSIHLQKLNTNNKFLRRQGEYL